MAEKLNTIEDIKVPYASEGIIRTAHIDDTISPENSVQLAVNMNFDQIGAIKTRPGVEEYADDIDGPVRNFGTLSNNQIQEGYTNIIQNEVTNSFDSDAGSLSVAQVDETHYVVFYQGADGDGFAVVVSVNLDTGVVTKLGTPLEFDIATAEHNACVQIDATHFLNFWTGSGDDAFVQAFAVNTGTWAVTALGSPLEFDTSGGRGFAPAVVDANHVTCLYINDSSLGVVSNFEVNLGTWAVTEVGSPLTLEPTNIAYPNVASIGNGTHFLATWSGSGLAKAQVYSVNTGTWNSTAIGSVLTYDASSGTYISTFSLGDGEHFVSAWSGPSDDGFVQTLNVNPSTYAVTALGTALEFDADNATFISTTSFEDGQHFGMWWRSNLNDGVAQIFSVDQTTYAITAISNEVTFETDSDVENVSVLINSSTVLNFWGSTGSTPGPRSASLFTVYGERERARYLYAQNGDNDILNWDGSTWTVRRTGLETAGKARFSQYLGYIWMVNGDEGMGGSPVMVSDGGDFSQGIVPDNFPPGNFIQTGFEGRVWVADSSSGAIYYTDIVQFTPPDEYTLTYDENANFITSISPQTGQTITALKEVPRALLVFTEDTITRIYGATSIDSYPAYNVGTYSQESIVTTKAGIYFHHSSGFYKFDYGTQPEEISRPVIDFVKAIPRANYDDIVGVYDGFDNVEWGIGQIVAEGVVFSSCVMRYTISTKVWTIYDYTENDVTAMIYYDDGTSLNHLMGTEQGKIGAMDVGYTDFGAPFYYEYIDRWRSYTDMYCKIKSLDGVNVYSENAAGANLMYQIQKSGPNAWQPIGTVNEKNNSLFPTAGTGDFDVMRFRLAGTTKGEPIIFHGLEIASLTIKGFNEN